MGLHRERSEFKAPLIIKKVSDEWYVVFSRHWLCYDGRGGRGTATVKPTAFVIEKTGRVGFVQWWEILEFVPARSGIPVYQSAMSHLLTYLLTPCSRVLLEKLTGSQLVKKFPAFYGTQRFITAFTSTRHLSLS